MAADGYQRCGRDSDRYGIAVAECVIELEGPRGKMRIQWRGATPPDLAGLSRVLWESA
jgi:hypothetical protein